MNIFYKRFILLWAFFIVCLLPINGYAVAYTFPGVSVPFGGAADDEQFTLNNDTLTVQNSSTMESTGNAQYTVNILPDPTDTLTGLEINVASGSTISYDGTNTTARTIFGNLNTATFDLTITNEGTIENGSSAFAIYIQNQNAGNGDLIINNQGTLGGVYTKGLDTTAIYLDGTVRITGGLTLNAVTSELSIGLSEATTFTSEATIQNIGAITVSQNSTFTQNFPATGIGTVTINPGSTYNLNASLGTAAGTITNEGTFRIAADITKTGAFNTAAATGNTIVTQNVSVATSTYANSGTHTAQFSDVQNYGNMELTVATPTFTNFTVTYTGGYLPGGTYTLITSQGAIATLGNITTPSDSLFLAFADPTITGAGNTLAQITITRTPFNTYASTPYTQSIGAALEDAGSSTPLSTSLLALLNGVEACTSSSCVTNSLQQLGPLVTAPLYAYTLENINMRSIQLRLASLRSDTYVAGDYDQFISGELLRENYFWIRPFTASAEQRSKQDVIGYNAYTLGFALGLDRNLDTRYSLGIAFAYSRSTVTDKIGNGSVTDVDSYQGIVYGSYNFDVTAYMDWLLSVTSNNYDGTRIIDFNGYNATADSSYGSQHIALKALWGKDYAAFDYLQVTPEASVLYVFSKQYEYQEQNGGGANLNVALENSNLVQIGIGGKLGIPLWVNPSIVVPDIHGMYLYNVVNGSQDTTFYFLEGSMPVISAFNQGRSALRLGAALTIAVFDSMHVKISADAQWQDRYSSYWGYLNLKWLL